MHAHSSHLHIHTQMHMTPAHTYAPTQMLYPFVPQHSQLCKCSDCMDRCPIVLPISCVQPLPVLPIHTCKLLHLLIYVCTHICMPNCPAKTHTHTQNPPACTYTHTCMRPVCQHVHTHTCTHSLDTSCFLPVPFRHWKVHVCVNFSGLQTYCTRVHLLAGLLTQHCHRVPEGWSPTDSWVPHGSRALSPDQAFGPQQLQRRGVTAPSLTDAQERRWA